MTPLQLEILLHYYTSPEDYPGVSGMRMNGSSEGHGGMKRGGASALKRIQNHGLISATGTGSNVNPFYRITNKGICYVTALLNTPLPVQRWHIPDETG